MEIVDNYGEKRFLALIKFSSRDSKASVDQMHLCDLGLLMKKIANVIEKI